MSKNLLCILLQSFIIIRVKDTKKNESKPIVTKKDLDGDYESPDGFHRHKCDKCGHVWEHSDKCRGQEEPHICANCGDIQGWKYFGPEPPSQKAKQK